MSAYLGSTGGKGEPIRLGMVGGGRGAFIGAVHRMAARLDDRYRLIAGALSSTPEAARESGLELGLAENRIYTDFRTMAQREARRTEGIEAVAIVTPNHLHADIAVEFLKRGIHVICDKPLTATVAQAKRLATIARQSKALFILTHNYSGYPMVRQARDMVATGALGSIRLVQAEYASDWLARPIENEGMKQAVWRTDPERSGGTGCVGDIGTHALQLATFVTGLEVDELSAEITTFVEGRRLDDNVQVNLHFVGGAKGSLWASQVAVGEENGLRLRVYGSEGGLEWHQEEPNKLWFTKLGEPKRLLTRMGRGATQPGIRVSRVPAGLPEGYLEGFANIYTEAAEAIEAVRQGRAPDPAATFPSLDDGLRGMAFVDACLRSSARQGRWVRPLSL